MQTKYSSEEVYWGDDDVEMSSLDHEKNMKVMYPRRPEQKYVAIPDQNEVPHGAGQLLLRGDNEYLSEGELTFEDHTALVSIVSEDAPLSSNHQPLQEVQLRGKFLIGDEAANMASLRRRKVYPPPPVPPKPNVKRGSYHEPRSDSQNIAPTTGSPNNVREHFKFWTNNQVESQPVAHGRTSSSASLTEQQIVSPLQKRSRMSSSNSEMVSYQRSSGVYSYDINTGDRQAADTVVHNDELNKMERMELRRPKHMEEMFLEARYERTMHESLEITSPAYVNNPAHLWKKQRQIRHAASKNVDSSFGSSCSSTPEYRATEGFAQELPTEAPCMADDIPSTQQYSNLSYNEIIPPSHVIGMLDNQMQLDKDQGDENHASVSTAKQTMPYQSSNGRAAREENGVADNVNILERTPLLDSFDDSSFDELSPTKSPELSFEKRFDAIASDSSDSDAPPVYDQKKVSKQSNFEPEDEVDEILENTNTETYSPTSTLSRAFTRPRHKHKKQKHKILKIKNYNSSQKKQLVTLQSVQTHCTAHRIEEESASIRSSSRSSQHSTKELHKDTGKQEQRVLEQSLSDNGVLTQDSGVVSPVDLNSLDDECNTLLQDELKVAVRDLLDPPRSTSSPVCDRSASASSTISSLHGDNSYDSVLSHEIELIPGATSDVSVEMNDKVLQYADVVEDRSATEEEVDSDVGDGIDLEKALDEEEFRAILSTSCSSDDEGSTSRADVSLSEILETSDTLINNQSLEEENNNVEREEHQSDINILCNGEVDDVNKISDSSSEDLDIIVRRNSELLNENEINQIILAYDHLRNEGIENGLLEDSEESQAGSVLTVLNAYSEEDCSVSQDHLKYMNVDTELIELENANIPVEIYNENIESLKMVQSPTLTDTHGSFDKLLERRRAESESKIEDVYDHRTKRNSIKSEPSPSIKRKMGSGLQTYKSVDTAIHELATTKADVEILLENRDSMKLAPSPVLKRKFDYQLAAITSELEELSKVDGSSKEIREAAHRSVDTKVDELKSDNADIITIEENRNSMRFTPSPVLHRELELVAVPTELEDITKSSSESQHSVDELLQEVKAHNAEIEIVQENRDSIRFTPSPILQKEFELVTISAINENSVKDTALECKIVEQQDLKTDLHKEAEPPCYVDEQVGLSVRQMSCESSKEVHLSKTYHEKVNRHSDKKVASFMLVDIPIDADEGQTEAHHYVSKNHDEQVIMTEYTKKIIDQGHVEQQDEVQKADEEFDSEEEKLIIELQKCDELYEQADMMEVVSLKSNDNNVENTSIITELTHRPGDKDINIGFVEYRTEIEKTDQLTTNTIEDIEVIETLEAPAPDEVKSSSSEEYHALDTTAEVSSSSDDATFIPNCTKEVKTFHQTDASDLYLPPDACIKETLHLQHDTISIPDAETYVKPAHVPDPVHSDVIPHRHSTDIEGQIDHILEVLPSTDRQQLNVDKETIRRLSCNELQFETATETLDKLVRGNVTTDNSIVLREEQSNDKDTPDVRVTDDNTTKLVAQSSLDMQFDKLLTDIEIAQHAKPEYTPMDDEDLMDTSELMEEYNDWHDKLVAESNTNIAVIATDEVLGQEDATHIISHVLHDDGVQMTSDLEKCLTPERDIPMTVASKGDMTVEVNNDEAEIVLEEEVTEQEITFLFSWPKNQRRPPNPMFTEAEPFREIHLRRVTRIKDVDIVVEDPEILCRERGKIVDSPKTAIKFHKDSEKSEKRTFPMTLEGGATCPHICGTDRDGIKVKNVVFKKEILTPACQNEHADSSASDNATCVTMDTNIDDTDDTETEETHIEDRRSSYRVTEL